MPFLLYTDGMRLDKFLCECLGLSRTDVKKLIQKGSIKVNDQVVKKADLPVREDEDLVSCQGQVLTYEKFVYYMLHKPAGVVSANSDDKDITVIDLFKKEGRKNLSCVGRLDKDTTGLLIVTDDGNLIHRLTSPKKGVYKDYLVDTASPVTAEMVKALEEGLDIGDDTPTLPAKVKVLDTNCLILSITEGRYHQVKRMLLAAGNEVTSLHRLSLGNVKLDPSLKPGEYRRLTKEELEELKSY